MEEAWEEEEEVQARAGQLTEPLHVRPAVGAGDREKPRPPRAWSDVLRYIWMYARGFACGVGRVLFFLRRESTAAAAGVVFAVERSGRHKNNRRQCNYAFMYGKVPKCQTGADDDGPNAKKSREQGDESDDKMDVLGVCRSDEPTHHDDPASQISNTATATESPPTPASPLMVNDERVWGEELCLFAHYCEESLTCGNRILCHWCIFEPHNYYGKNKFRLSDMLLHSRKVHNTLGFKCKTCQVRVGTPRELLLHIHFCHELKTGWWKLKLYKEKMKVMKTD